MYELPEVGPGGSVQASVTRNGLAVVAHAASDRPLLAASCEKITCCLIVEHVRSCEDVEEVVRVCFTHALAVRPQGVVGAGAIHVAR